MSTWYMSFANDDGFLGAIMLDASSIEEAHQKTWEMKINPGGEVLGLEVPEGLIVPDSFKGRLLSKDDLAEFDGGTQPKRLADLSPDESAVVHENAAFICEKHQENP